MTLFSKQVFSLVLRNSSKFPKCCVNNIPKCIKATHSTFKASVTHIICKDEDVIVALFCVHGTLGNPLGQVDRLERMKRMNENQIFESR